MTKDKKLVQIALVLFVVSFTAQVDASIVVYEKVAFITGSDSINESFTVPVSGECNATLTDFEFPVLFDFLIFAVTTGTQMMGYTIGPGSFLFDAVPGVTYFANIAGDAGAINDGLELGLFGAQVSLNAVPVPATLLLFASGLLGLWGLTRKFRG
jgi:hypothetical protein